MPKSYAREKKALQKDIANAEAMLSELNQEIHSLEAALQDRSKVKPKDALDLRARLDSAKALLPDYEADLANAQAALRRLEASEEAARLLDLAAPLQEDYTRIRATLEARVEALIGDTLSGVAELDSLADEMNSLVGRHVNIREQIAALETDHPTRAPLAPAPIIPLRAPDRPFIPDPDEPEENMLRRALVDFFSERHQAREEGRRRALKAQQDAQDRARREAARDAISREVEGYRHNYQLAQEEAAQIVKDHDPNSKGPHYRYENAQKMLKTTFKAYLRAHAPYWKAAYEEFL